MTHSDSQYLKAIRLALFSISNTLIFLYLYFPQAYSLRIFNNFIACLIILLQVRVLFCSSPWHTTSTRPEVQKRRKTVLCI